MRQVAEDNDVAVVENPPLARALHKQTKEGQQIPLITTPLSQKCLLPSTKKRHNGINFIVDEQCVHNIEVGVQETIPCLSQSSLASMKSITSKRQTGKQSICCWIFKSIKVTQIPSDVCDEIRPSD